MEEGGRRVSVEVMRCEKDSASAAGNRRKTWVWTEKTDGAGSKELVATDVTGRRSRTPLPHINIP